ncbi:MAG: hypothetical protein EON58_10080 [Alphaproteobacteria bacterium]|nr:MAG: hypothetical protein EON58_10080 [Alphaproteobacteria bacterium]
MIKLKDELRDYLLRNCPKRTERVLMERFGISYNTFRKIEAGGLIRRSLAVRLESRLEAERSVEKFRLPLTDTRLGRHDTKAHRAPLPVFMSQN